MSKEEEESPKHCANKKKLSINKTYKKLLLSLSGVFSSIFFLILLLFLILHPSKPEFSLKQLDLYQLNFIDFHLLNSSIQFTLFSKNPNQRVGIYYDQLQVYASYKGQQITMDTSLPHFYQGHEDTNLLTAFLVGSGFPVPPSIGYEVGRDHDAGRFVLNLKAMGRIRWKVGSWVSGGYRLNVDCVAVLPFVGSDFPTAPLSLKKGSKCSTSL